MKRLANIGLIVLIGLLLAVSSTVTLVPALTHTRAVNIVAGSMTGTLDYGSLVYIDPAKTPKVGDIITFKFGANSPVTHRVMAIEPDPSGNDIEYVTKGDFNATNDAQPAPRSTVVGVVVNHLPMVGMLTGLLGKMPVQLFLGCVALGLYWASTRKPNVRRATASGPVAG